MASVNPFIIGLASTIIAILSYFIDQKLSNEEYNKKKLIKVVLLGILIGISNLILFSLLQSNESISTTQDILTGQPNF